MTFWDELEEKKKAEKKKSIWDDLPDYLQNDARCPICGRFYHRLNIWRNPIGNRQYEDLCQCPRGRWARKMMREYHNEQMARRKERRKRIREALKAKERARQFWEKVKAAKRTRPVRPGGSLTAGIAPIAEKEVRR